MPPPARLLWDHGGLWALMTWTACRQAGLPLSPITAQEIAHGGLAGAGLLVVPGGLGRLKKAALGSQGAREVRRFVTAGGRYLGFCGGAGLALSVKGGLGLVALGRQHGSGRLPSLSGPVWATPGRAQSTGHPLWQGQRRPQRFFVWWPGQFASPLHPSCQEVARYQGPAPGLCSSDLEVDQVSPGQWPALEKSYGLQLDPAGLAGQAAVIAAPLGQGSLLLSYLHLDTPGEKPGLRSLGNLWRAWLGVRPAPRAQAKPPRDGGPASELADKAQELWEQGRQMGLWRPRHPWLPLWRRGARGLEFWELRCCCRALAQTQAGDELAAGLAKVFRPLWRHGPKVLAAQAARLAGQPPRPAETEIFERWFPGPHRVAGELAESLAALQNTLLAALRSV